MVLIPIQQPVAKKDLSRDQIFAIGLKCINIDNVCKAMEAGRLVAPAIVKYLIGSKTYSYLGSDLQEILVRDVQKIVYKNKLTLSILGNSN